MKLYIFDDAVADGWAPFALTRPCSELLLGTHLSRERLEAFAGTGCVGILSRPWLGFYREEGTPPVLRPEETAVGEDRLFLSSRAVPARHLRYSGRPPAVLRMAGRIVGCHLAAGASPPEGGWLGDPGPLRGARDVEVEGSVLDTVWDLVAENPRRLLEDLRGQADEAGSRGRRRTASPAPAGGLPRGVERLGDGPVLLGPGVRLEPGVLLDTREGPIRLDADVEVRAGTRLAGPLHAGRGSRLLGGSLAALSAGPLSYLRGEVEESVVLGYSNKAHDGFLGHAYLGRWVNLGALTTNSDLKNNYGTVRVGPPDSRVDTGLRKLGCFLGDHAKTGIGLLLDTGTVVGAGSNLFGGVMPPTWVPPFSWGSGRSLEAYRKEEFLRTAAVAMGRRGVEMDADVREWLGATWEAGRPGEATG